MSDAKDSLPMRHATAIAIMVLTLLSLLASLAFYRQSENIANADAWVHHSYEVKTHIQELLNRFRDAVGSERSYLFTGDESFLHLYNDAVRPATDLSDDSTRYHSIAEETAILRRQTADNAVQQKLLDDIDDIKTPLLSFLAAGIDRRKQQTASEGILNADPRYTKQAIDRLRALLGAMTVEENRLLAGRTAADVKSIRVNNLLTFSTICVFYVLMALAVVAYQRSRNQAQAALAAKAGELEQASKYKSEFLANMSHELRTPLNSLLILARSLESNEEGNLTAEQVEEAHIIHNDGLELLNLINEILDLSKVEAGKIELIPEDLAVDAFAHKLQQQFAAIARQRNLAFPVTVEQDMPRSIRTDGYRVERIVKNLLSNAFKFTQQGSVSLRFHKPDLAAHGDGADWIACSVADTGIGIEPARFGDIFEAFRQEDGATDRQYGGTGLGLTIARKFAHLLGGEIHVESQKGIGSVFTLLLPTELPAFSQNHADTKTETESGNTLSVQQKIMTAETARILPLRRERETAFAGFTVLLADDDLRNSFALSKILKQCGMSVVMADNGQMALDILNERPVDLVVMDMVMPVMQGYQAIRGIRARPELAALPVIALTSRAMPDERGKCLEAGADIYLTKPLDVETLLAALHDLLPQKEQAV